MKFKVGDRVQVVAQYSAFYGDKGTVTENDDARMTYPYTVKFDDGDDCMFRGSDLIVLSTEKFKVGDKVKVSGSWRGNSGKVGTVSRTDWGVMYKYRVEFEDADPESFKEEELELVKEEEKVMEFKVGDKVVVNRGWENIYEGKKGKIIDISSFGHKVFYKIKFEDSSVSDGGFYGENLKIVEHKPKFKLGDKVRILDSRSFYFGQEGEIKEIDNFSKEYPFVVCFDSKFSCYSEVNMELVKIDEMKELKEKYKEAYKQYEETKEIEKDLIVKTGSNIKKQNELVEILANLEVDILKEAKK